MSSDSIWLKSGLNATSSKSTDEIGYLIKRDSSSLFEVVSLNKSSPYPATKEGMYSASPRSCIGGLISFKKPSWQVWHSIPSTLEVQYTILLISSLSVYPLPKSILQVCTGETE